MKQVINTSKVTGSSKRLAGFRKFPVKICCVLSFDTIRYICAIFTMHLVELQLVVINNGGGQ